MNCRICGAQLTVGAMFCGECGSSTTATPRSRQRPDPRPADTTIIQPLPPAPTVISVPVPVPAAAPVAARVAPAADPAAADPAADPAAVERVAPGPGGPGATAEAAEPAPASAAARFLFQFSTGETVSVRGSGLIGRRPLPQPAEYFDHLIQIADVGMSVSKSHLEFGQHDGELWINDRFSGNGTILRRPDAAALRCEPGRRYFVPRGSRVEIAEQFFVVT